MQGNCLTIKRENCGYCGGSPHKRNNCPASRCVCYECNRIGHFAKVCRSTGQSSRAVASVAKDNSDNLNLAARSATSHSQQDDKLNVYIMLNGMLANALIDTGAKHNHIDSKFCRTAGLKSKSNDAQLSLGLAVKGSSVKTMGSCLASVELLDRNYEGVKFLILENLLWDVILGQEFLSQHENVNIVFGGSESPLNLGALKPLTGIKPVKLFEHLSLDCHPIKPTT